MTGVLHQLAIDSKFHFWHFFPFQLWIKGISILWHAYALKISVGVRFENNSIVQFRVFIEKVERANWNDSFVTFENAGTEYADSVALEVW